MMIVSIVDLDFYLYELSDIASVAFSSFSVFSTIGTATFIIFLYANTLSKKQKELEFLANTDVLTNTNNRRKFFTSGEEIFDLANRYDFDFSIISIDIDHFKFVNDTYGHNIGDEVLIEFSNIISKHIRRKDMFARIGGEEFVVITRETSYQEGFEIAEKLRFEVEREHIFVGDFEISITISCGVVQYDSTYSSFDEMMIQVDKALYDAKEAGRNRVKQVGE
jgi:diguanylate cyclase (GGDEF)-like protein